MKKKKDAGSSEPILTPPSPFRSLIPPLIVFLLTGGVYLATLFSLYPNLPILENNADTSLGAIYIKTYPPFRMDEYNYYIIAQNILKGDIYREGSLERSFSIGYPLVMAPFVAVWNKMGGYIANTVIVLLSLFVFYRILRRYITPIKASIMALFLAFATVEWFYAVSCYTEPLAQLCLLAGFFLLIKAGEPSWRYTGLFLSGALIGLNLFVRAHYAILVLPIFLFLWLDRGEKKFTFHHRAFWFAGGAAVVAGIWIVRNAVFFGGPLSFEYTRMLGQFSGSSDRLGGNLFWGLHQLLFDTRHGLLTITPILLLFPAGLTVMWRAGAKREMLIILTSVTIMVLIFAASPYPFTEFGLGSRHMVPIIPLIMLPAAFLLDDALSHRIVVTLLALYSFYYAGLGWFTGNGGEYIGHRGFFVGMLHSDTSKAILLQRRNLLPKKTFTSRQELIDTFTEGFRECDYMTLFQTLNPKVVENIRGHEREFVTYIRQNAHPESLVVSIDPKDGILFREMRFVGSAK